MTRSVWSKTSIIISLLLIFTTTFASAQMANTAFWQQAIQGAIVSAQRTLDLLAGSISGAGYQDGTGSLARFNDVTGLATDAAGNIYAADHFNHVIRKITPSGVVSTLAGSAGQGGYEDGTGTAARFLFPWDIAVDSFGNVFVTDLGNYRIRKISPAGVVTTFAGSGSNGYADGTGTAATFSDLTGIAVDSAGSLFVADTGNFIVRKITTAGVVTTFAGMQGIFGNSDGTGTAASFGDLSDLAIDGSNNIYVLEITDHTIRKITASGIVTTFAGTAGVPGYTDGTGSAAEFASPFGLAIDPTGNLFVSGSAQSVRKVTPAGVVTTFAGDPNINSINMGPSPFVRFNRIRAITIDPSGAIFVFDDNHIRKITASGTASLFVGDAPESNHIDGSLTNARFMNPVGITEDPSGNVYITDSVNHVIRKITAAGVVSTFAGYPGLAGSTNATGLAARFNNPLGIAADSAGNLYVADTGNHLIRRITPAGAVTTFAGMDGVPGSTNATGTSARFNMPLGVAVDGSGNVFVADSQNNLIRRITSARVVTTHAGSGAVGNANGTGTAATFNSPTGIAVDSAGTVYVSSETVIRKITSARVVTTLAGSYGTEGYVDGTGTAANFKLYPFVTTDSSGNVYVSDTSNCTVRTVTSAGVVTTIAGQPEQCSFLDGTGSDARFGFPAGIKFSSSGFIYVVDAGTLSIRKVTTAGVTSTWVGMPPPTTLIDGTGPAATVAFAFGLGVDSTGNVCFADQLLHVVRKVNSAGAVTTIAGSALLTGSIDGTGASARFNKPFDVACDSSGNMYVTDERNSVLRKVTSSGVVTTLAGSPGIWGADDGTGAAASFAGPRGIAIDPYGDLIVADTGNNLIRRVTPSGVVTTVAGISGVAGSTNGPASNATFNSPSGVAVDSGGNIFVGDEGNGVLRKITPGGVVSTLAGTPAIFGSADGTGAAAEFGKLDDLATDASGNIYIADSGASSVRKVTPAGVVTKVVGNGGLGATILGPLPARINGPKGVAVFGNTLYISVQTAVLKADLQ